MSELALGTVIYAAVKPVIKIYLIIGCGFILARFNILTVETARILADMVLIIIGPCLTFNKIVTSISGSDIKTIGIIVLTSCILFTKGFLCAVLSYFTTPVSPKWVEGLFCAAISSNGGDLPIAYMQSMDTGLIFSATQGSKGIAYIQIFAALSTFVQFNLGGYRLVEYDFRKKDKIDDDENCFAKSMDEEKLSKDSDSVNSGDVNEIIAQNEALKDESDNENAILDDDESETHSLSSESSTNEVNQKNYDPIPFSKDSNSTASSKDFHKNSKFHKLNKQISTTRSNSRNSRGSKASKTSKPRTNSFFNHKNSINLNDSRRISHTVSLNSQLSYMTMNSSIRNMELRTMPSQNINDLILEYTNQTQPIEPKHSNLNYLTEIGQPLNKIDEKPENFSKIDIFINRYHLNFLLSIIKNFKRPQAIAVIVSVTCAMIPWVKALFVSTGSVVLPNAPDQLPPLSFIMDFTSYIGAAQVPMGLLLLGSTLARLKIDKFPTGFWKTSILTTGLKLCAMPIIGLLWCTLVKHKSWLGIDKDLSSIGFFIICLNWGLPSGTNQIYLTASYTDPNDLEHLQMDCLAIVLLNEYAVLVISLPFLVTYTIKVFLGY